MYNYIFCSYVCVKTLHKWYLNLFPPHLSSLIVGFLFSLLHNHRIIEWFGFGTNLTDHLVPPPWHGQGHLPPDPVAQCPVQPGLEHCQGGGTHSFSGQPVPAPHHPQSEELPPYIESKSTSFSFKLLSKVLPGQELSSWFKGFLRTCVFPWMIWEHRNSSSTSHFC